MADKQAVVVFEKWLVVGTLLTLGTAVFAYSMLPFTHMSSVPRLTVIQYWVMLMSAVWSVFILWDVVKLAKAGEPRPIAKLIDRFNWRSVGIGFLGSFVLGLNLALFGIVKPQLGQITPFTADPMLAAADHFLFRSDPWRLLEWFHHPGMSPIYHEGWFLFLAFVLVYLLILKPSPEKDRALISYLLIWSVLGPLVHLAMPAAGPIFYEALGLGRRFADMKPPSEALTTANYLWTGYVDREFNAAGGISAMPSVHLATMFWSIFVLRKTRWLIFSIVFTAYIFTASVALGWHYAVDGIAGGICAVVAWWIAGPLPKFQRSLDSTALVPR